MSEITFNQWKTFSQSMRQSTLSSNDHEIFLTNIAPELRVSDIENVENYESIQREYILTVAQEIISESESESESELAHESPSTQCRFEDCYTETSSKSMTGLIKFTYIYN